MNIAKLLTENMPSHEVARMFVIEMASLCSADELAPQVAVEFINVAMLMIGLDYQIDISEIDLMTFQWPEHISSYTFEYNSIKFHKFELFLECVCEYANSKTYQELYDGIVNVLPHLIELISIWVAVCNDMAGIVQVAEQFKEPFARISYALLAGLHAIRKEHRLIFPLLDEMCHRLYLIVVMGLRSRSYFDLVQGITTLFERDFKLFTDFSEDALNFFFLAFSIKGTIHTRLHLIKTISSMVTDETMTSNEVLILTNYLISENMLRVYFDFINRYRPKKLIIETLNLIYELQRHLPVIDCFGRIFIERILDRVLDNDEEIRLRAGAVYIGLMKRREDDRFILKHIMEYYMSSCGYIEKLNCYVRALWNVFPLIQSIQIYLKIIVKETQKIYPHVFAAHFAVAVYGIMLTDIEHYREPIQNVLINLPATLFQLEKHELERGILFKFYALTVEQMMMLPQFSMIIDIFEDYTLDCIINLNDGYPLMNNMFIEFSRFLEISMHWHKLEILANKVYQQYREMATSLPLNDDPIAVPTDTDLDSIKRFTIAVKKLSIVMRSPYPVLDFMNELLIDLEKRFIKTSQIQDFTAKDNSFLDIYAIATYTECLKTMCIQREYTKHEKKFITARAKALQLFIFGMFACSEQELQAMHVGRAYMYFTTLVDIYRQFHQNSNIFHIELTAEKYSIITQFLILFTFNAKLQTSSPVPPQNNEESMMNHPLRTLEYQQHIIKKYTELHRFVDVPSNNAWKVCIYYELGSHKFNDELTELLLTICKYKLKNFTYIIPVVVFNLNNRQPPLAFLKIRRVIKAYKTFIDTKAELENPIALKLHVVLTVLQMIGKTLEVFLISEDNNRLIALKTLNILIDDLVLYDSEGLRAIYNQLCSFKNYLLNVVEQETLKDYMSSLKKE